ncbi:hypothetical protein PN498_11625 [Oscillatoria sp. CS-180]|uniref:hypothetical protein n=1 Tax=Oscillatoria sp. CS-180 TaxID=3021720 RepID=UPI00232C51C7|nr:hypothetical protein [Oscillatoria sp. CS-180]MDB9526642.1 hypothetical protein [Oscillatoria sp. CS-180]
MAIIALKAWYLEQYEPARELEKRPQDLRLSRNSLLKAGMRADFLDDSEDVKQSTWFQRYLSGEAVEFYIEGSGTYTISNIDLLSHEMYFAKQESLVQLEPFIFFCYQTDYDESSALIREGLESLLGKVNRKSRLSLSLEESNRGGEGALRRNSPLMRKLRKSLLFIADGTSVAQSPGKSPQLLPSANVCVELGYALQCKRPEQIILARQERDDLPGHFPFEIPSEQQIIFHNSSDLSSQLKTKIEGELKRYSLL